MARQGRILHRDWDLYDTRHVVFKPARLTARAAGGRLLARLPRLLPLGLDPARRVHQGRRCAARLRHAAYAGRLEEVRAAWDLLIRAKRAGKALPLLEAILSGFGSRPAVRATDGAASADVTPAPPAVSP